MRRRFFVDSFANSRATLHGEAAHHLGKVLRAQPGQLYELSDGQRVHLARIELASRDRIEFALLEELSAHIPTLDLTLLLSIVKFDAFEWAIEKATELGVTKIVPLAAGRSEKGLLAAAPKRSDRWTKLLLEASQQSRRLRPPILTAAITPADAFANSQNQSHKILLSERPDAPPLRTLLTVSAAPSEPPAPGPHFAVLAIGPEGGWTDPELSAATAANFQPASLGHLILRTETAVIAALASINFALSD